MTYELWAYLLPASISHMNSSQLCSERAGWRIALGDVREAAEAGGWPWLGSLLSQPSLPQLGKISNKRPSPHGL